MRGGDTGIHILSRRLRVNSVGAQLLGYENERGGIKRLKNLAYHAKPGWIYTGAGVTPAFRLRPLPGPVF